jgi:hypothetical protein
MVRDITLVFVRSTHDDHFNELGNLKQVYGRHTLSWHSESVKKVGKAFRIHGNFWVFSISFL